MPCVRNFTKNQSVSGDFSIASVIKTPLRWLCACILFFSTQLLADDVLLYSSVNQIFGVNLDSGEEVFVTTASLSPTVNALATNSVNGLIYYGDGTSIYYWDAALGAGSNSHVLINNFENGFFQAPITNLNSAGGSYLNGKYYVGSEDDQGFVEELFELTMSSDGKQIVSVTALNLQNACNCSKFQLGGFGDIAAIDSANGPVIYGSSTDLTADGLGTHAGIWRLDLASGSWTLLAPGVGGQLAASLDGRLFSNVGNNIREIDPFSGATSSQSLFTTASAIWDFTGGFSYDYGDAPDSYGAAMHLVDGASAFVFLGQNRPDNESYSQHAGAGGVDGLGDDNKGLADEDGVLLVPELDIDDENISVQVDCNTGYVAAWLDFNLNGQFDLSERNSNYPLQCTSGAALLEWSNIDIGSPGNTYLRIRAASDINEIYKPTGISSSGEVEDYNVTINGSATTSGNCPAGSVSYIYNSTDVPKTYSGSANVYSTVNVPDSLTITDVNVLNINATHATQRRLYFYLNREGSNTYLYGNMCTANQGFTINFDDDAPTTVPCPPSSGEFYRPRQLLSQYDGSDAMGDWQLRLFNRNRNNSGRLNSWTLEICAAGVTNSEPDIRLGKLAEVNERTVTMTLLLRNTGSTVLSSLSLVDNLDIAFGVGNYALLAPPEIVSAPAGITVNQSYTGQSASAQIINSGTLQPGQQVEVRFSVDVPYSGVGADSNYLNQAYVSAIDGSNLIEDLSSTGLDLSIDEDIPTPISLSNSVQVGGVVFNDTTDNAQTSHDGVQQASEEGVAGRAVSIVDVASGQEIATAVTVANGLWSAELDIAYINQTIEVRVTPVSSARFISETPLNTDSSNADGRVTQLVQSDSSLNQSSIGLITQPSLVIDQSSNLLPDSAVLYAHTYTSPTHGELQLTLNGTSTSPNAGWNYALYQDVDCNAQLGSGDQVLTASLNVGYEQEICLLVLVESGSTAVAGDSLAIELLSDLAPSDLASTSHNVSFTISNQDVTTIIAGGAGNLVLSKTVQNLSVGGATTNQNSALPGHILEYAIAYSNTGNGNVNDLVINDESPAFTQIQSGSADCSQTPPNMTCTPDVNGAQIRWVFTGALSSGASGEVRYRVLVE